MKIYLVGGAVRDQLLGLTPTERDFVVVGASSAELLAQGFRQVGKEFPVFLHPETNEEYALARLERKVGKGYTGFTFDASPQVSLEEDLLRRDLTINAMAIDLDTNQLIDPFHGADDLKKGVLRHVSCAFAEDPVRILRVGRFLARFAARGFYIHSDTINLMQAMVNAGEVDALVAERVWKELSRALTENTPSAFFTALGECHALPILFPYTSLADAGLRALALASDQGQPNLVRFAAWLHDLPSHPNAPSDAIALYCNRYKVPTEFSDLAKLTAQHYQAALTIHEQTPEAILSLLSHLDSFRRTTRFAHFVTTCNVIAATCGLPPSASQLLTYHEAAQTVSVKELIATGITGEALGQAIKSERLKKIIAKHSAK